MGYSAIRDLFAYFRLESESAPEIRLYHNGSYSAVDTQSKISNLTQQLHHHFKQSIRNIDSFDLKEVVTDTQASPPVIWFYQSDDVLSQLIIALFSLKEDGYTIYGFADPYYDIQNYWNITQLPSLFCVLPDHKVYPFEYAFNVKNLKKYFRNINHIHAQFHSPNNKTADHVRTTAHLQEACAADPCVVFLLKRQSQIHLINQVLNYFKDISFHWVYIDQKCNKKLIKK